MIEIILVLLAAWLFVWWLRFTIRTFSTVAVCLWQAALSVGTIVHLLWQMVSTPRAPDLLGEFLEKRRAAQH